MNTPTSSTASAGPVLRVLSLGAGVQSTALLILAATHPDRDALTGRIASLISRDPNPAENPVHVAREILRVLDAEGRLSWPLEPTPGMTEMTGWTEWGTEWVDSELPYVVIRPSEDAARATAAGSGGGVS